MKIIPLEQRQEILSFLRAKLEPHAHVYALWLKGADARGIVDEFSDLDIWLDVEDGQEESVLKQLEQYLNELAPLDLVTENLTFIRRLGSASFI
jgi:predicted nucleotidyltransferase